jgi:hypothetical protein
MRSAGTVSNLHPYRARVVALSMLLAAACLWFAVATPFALAQPVDPNMHTGAPMPGQQHVAVLVQDTPEEPTAEPQPTPDETAESAPSETPEPPTETAEPGPGETPEPP